MGGPMCPPFFVRSIVWENCLVEAKRTQCN